MATATISDFAGWIGGTETATDDIAPTPCAALSATLDRAPERPPAGTPLPPLWHWLYFLPLHRQSDIGPDGHAKRGGFLPPVPLPRRMWAGGDLEFKRSLSIGDRASRVSTIVDFTDKSGRSGPLVFVKVRHEIRANDDAQPAIVEFHDIVYRDAPKPGDAPSPPKAAPRDFRWQRRWVPDDVLLFRYSALTFNGHRIHYDRKYVTEVEGYPGLVVHGPLIATLLIDLLRSELPDAVVQRFQFRAARPLFDIHPFDVSGEPRLMGKASGCGRATMKARSQWGRLRTSHDELISLAVAASVRNFATLGCRAGQNVGDPAGTKHPRRLDGTDDRIHRVAKFLPIDLANGRPT